MRNSPLHGPSRFLTLLVMVAALVCDSTPRAAAADVDDAKTRAALFQAEARKIFEKDHWSIVRNGPTGFTAVHPAASGGSSSPTDADDPTASLIVHVSITFTPKSVGSTDCAVKIEGFHLIPRKNGQKFHLAGPFKADYPENSKYIQKVLETAEDRLGNKYPKYEAK